MKILLLFLTVLSPRADLVEALSDALTIPYSKTVGAPRHWRTCRQAPGGCRLRIETFVDHFVDAGEAYDVDPWLLAAMAYSESRLNPRAEGKAGERTIMQFIRSTAGQDLRWWWRDQPRIRRCLSSVGECQRGAVFRAAQILHNGINRYGSEFAALCFYNSGTPSGGVRYARRVLKVREELRR